LCVAFALNGFIFYTPQHVYVYNTVRMFTHVCLGMFSDRGRPGGPVRQPEEEDADPTSARRALPKTLHVPEEGK